MSHPLPAKQRKLPPQDPARPSSFFTSPNNFNTPIALAPKPVARNWILTLLSNLGATRGRIASIQQSMLDELGQVATSPLHEEPLARLIVQAEDAESLWALRHGLSEAICQVHGEVIAHQKMTEISFMFAGLLRRGRSPGTGTGPGGLSGENVVRLSPHGQQSRLPS